MSHARNDRFSKITAPSKSNSFGDKIEEENIKFYKVIVKLLQD